MAEKERETKPYNTNVRWCPRCGPGYRLADHKDRWSCGRCGYFERK